MVESWGGSAALAQMMRLRADDTGWSDADIASAVQDPQTVPCSSTQTPAMPMGEKVQAALAAALQGARSPPAAANSLSSSMHGATPVGIQSPASAATCPASVLTGLVSGARPSTLPPLPSLQASKPPGKAAAKLLEEAASNIPITSKSSTPTVQPTASAPNHPLPTVQLTAGASLIHQPVQPVASSTMPSTTAAPFPLPQSLPTQQPGLPVWPSQQFGSTSLSQDVSTSFGSSHDFQMPLVGVAGLDDGGVLAQQNAAAAAYAQHVQAQLQVQQQHLLPEQQQALFALQQQVGQQEELLALHHASGGDEAMFQLMQYQAQLMQYQAHAMTEQGDFGLWTPDGILTKSQTELIQTQEMEAEAKKTAEAAAPPKPVHRPRDPRYHDGRYRGLVKCFDLSKGYGFIVSEELEGRYGSDVFLHHQQKRNFDCGSEVTFTMKLNNKGQPQAYDLRKIKPTEPAPASEEASLWNAPIAGRHDEKETLGRYNGIIKNFHADKGYGFIECPNVRARGYSHDVFIHHTQMTGLEVGDTVQFTCYVNSKHQPQCKDLARGKGLAEESIFGGIAEPRQEPKRQRRR